MGSVLLAVSYTLRDKADDHIVSGDHVCGSGAVSGMTNLNMP